MLGCSRVRLPYRRFLAASHHTPVRYRPPLSLRRASHMSTTSPIHPVETTQQRSSTALDKPHADTDITKNGGTQKVKEKKPKEQSSSAYPLEVRPIHLLSYLTMPETYDSAIFVAQSEARVFRPQDPDVRAIKRCIRCMGQRQVH